MRRLLSALLLALPLLAVAPPAAAMQMTNEDVIKLLKSGLSEETVLQAIQGAEPRFDTSTDGLVKLKQGGVSDRIIQQVMAKQSGKPMAAPGLEPLPAQTAPAQPAAAAPPPPQQQQTCVDCGTITNIKEVKKKGSASGAGALTGALIGGGLGYAVGGRGHRTAGTLIGAGGGALAGNYIEKNASAGREFRIDVRLDNGAQQTFRYDSMPNWGVGTRVRVVNGQLTSLNY
jgi:outer membrane lipoprotein SlyB